MNNKGFSLIEIIITIAILGILSSYALPSFSHLLSRNQQRSVLFQLFRHHQLARSEAIKRNQSIILCKSSNARQCNPAADWHEGWIIFADTDNNRLLNGTESLIYSYQGQNYKLSVNYRGFGSHNYIRYFPDGHSSTNGTFVLCSRDDSVSAKSLIISRTGRARIDTKNASGTPLVCP